MSVFSNVVLHTLAALVRMCACRMRLIGLMFIFRIGASSWCGWPCTSRSGVRILAGANVLPGGIQVPRLAHVPQQAETHHRVSEATTHVASEVSLAEYVDSRSVVSFAPPPQTRANTLLTDTLANLRHVRTEVPNDMWDNVSELGFWENQSASSYESEEIEAHYRRAYKAFLGDLDETPNDSFRIEIDHDRV